MSLLAIAGPLIANFATKNPEATGNIIEKAVDGLFGIFGGKDKKVDVTTENKGGIISLLTENPEILETLLQSQKKDAAEGTSNEDILAGLDEEALEGLLNLLISGGGLDIAA